MSMLLYLAILRPPVSHCIPVHPRSQVQVSGDVQVPPFWQELLQVAENIAQKYQISMGLVFEVDAKHMKHVMRNKGRHTYCKC